MKRLLFLGAFLLPSLALAEATPVVIVGQPVQVAGTFTSAGQGNTFGATATLNANSVCATVWLAGQRGASFDLVPGTLGATLTPSFSANATQVSNGCNAASGDWTVSKFLDPVTGVETATLVVTNPNAGALLNVKIGSASCAKVCTGPSGTTGTTTAFLVATQATATPAPAADTSDRAGRLLGVIYGSQGQQIKQSPTNFNAVSELAVGATLIDPRAVRALTTSDAITASQGGSWTVGLTGTVPLPTGAATSALQTTLSGQLPTTLDGSGFLKTHEQGTVAVTAGALPLPAGAAADATLTGGTQKAIARGGAKGASSAADVTSTAEGTDHQALDVQLWLSGSALDPRTRTWTLSSGTDSVAAVQSGTWTATVSGTVTTTPPSNASTNISQINGVTVLTGSGVSGTGAERVAVATSDGNTLATANTGRLQVDVVTGGGSNASVGATGSAVPASATLVGGSKSGNTAALLLDASGNLNVNVAAGGGSGGTSSSFGSAFPATGTAVGAKDSTGANLAALNLDASGFLKVNVAAGGGSGGTSSTFGAASPGTGTAAGGFTTTAAPTYVTGNMGALSLTTAGELRSIITSALPAGSNVLGHVIADSGSTTAVTSLPATPAGTNLIGKVGIDQTTPGTTNGVQVNAALPAGTNVIGHVIHDSGSTTAVTGNVTVVQPTGTSLHVVADSTSTTAATQATAANLNAQVQGAAASGASKSGNPVQQGLVFNTAQPTVTTGQVVEAQATARGAQIVATGADTFSVAVTSAPTTAVTIATLPALTAGSAVIGHTINDSGSTTAVTSLPAIPTGSNTIGAVTGPAAAALALDATLTGGTLKAKVTGNGGAAMDAAGQNAASPANELLIAGQFNTTPTTITSGNVSPLQTDSAGNLLVNIKAGASSGAVAQGSTTSGQTGSLVQAAALSAAPSYSNATTNPLTTDLAGNLRVTAGAPADVPVGPTSISAACSDANINTSCVSGRVSVAFAGENGVSVTQVNSGFTGTVKPDCQLGNGRWVAGQWADPVSCALTTVSAGVTTDSNTFDRVFICPQGSQAAGIRGATLTAGTVSAMLRATVAGGMCSFYDASGTGSMAAKLVSGSTTAATQATASSFNAQVVGAVASAASNSGNPVKEGLVAHTALPTAATDNQIMDGMADKFGRVVMVANADRALVTQATVTLTASTTETTLLTAGGANVLLDLTYLKCSNTSTTASAISIRDATAGTVRDTLVCPAAIGPCEGAVYSVPFKQTTANNNWTIQAGTSASSIICTAQAVQNK